jgi:hypothetical protein
MPFDTRLARRKVKKSKSQVKVMTLAFPQKNDFRRKSD